MKTDAELKAENSSASREIGGQSDVCESSVATPLGSEEATRADAGAPASEARSVAAQIVGQAKAVMAHPVGHSVGTEKTSLAEDAGGDNQIGHIGDSSVGIASSGATALTPLGHALAALDRRDYATARRLFEALGRKDVALAIDNALAALDRNDYATAQGLFEALTPLKLAPPVRGSMASDSREKVQCGPAIPPLAVVPSADAPNRRPTTQEEKGKGRGLKRIFFRTGVVFFAVLAASATYISPANWMFATMKSQAIAGLGSAVDLVKAPLDAITGQSRREQERSAMRDVGAAVTQLAIRLDQIEHDYGARLDKLDARIDQNSSSRFADMAGRIAQLEQKGAAPPPMPASELADVVARLDKLEKNGAVAAAPASEFADIVTRLDRLEKRAAVVPTVSSATPLPPAKPKQSTLAAKAERSASIEILKPDNPGPLLSDFSVEGVRDGFAVVGGRYGPQQVAVGGFLPGAGRVLRIERRAGKWFVVTSRGVIASGLSGPSPYQDGDF